MRKLGAKVLPNGKTIMFLEGDPTAKIVQCWVYGKILNYANAPSKKKVEWHEKIIDTVKKKRSGNLTENDLASISLSLFFYPKLWF